MLLLVGRRIAIVHQRQVRAHAVGDPLQLEIEVEPPPGVLAAEHDHERRQEQDPAERPADGEVARLTGPIGGCAADAPEHDQDRERDERPEAVVRRLIGLSGYSTPNCTG